jgi:hypothetical protein
MILRRPRRRPTLQIRITRRPVIGTNSSHERPKTKDTACYEGVVQLDLGPHDGRDRCEGGVWRRDVSV